MYHEEIVPKGAGERAGHPAQAAALGHPRRAGVYLRAVSGGEPAGVCLRCRNLPAAAHLLRGAGAEGLRALLRRRLGEC